MATTLACGLIGLEDEIVPDEAVTVDAKTLGVTLPVHLSDALTELGECERLKTVLGERFVEAYIDVKQLELRLYNRVISSWEREYLLLNV